MSQKNIFCLTFDKKSLNFEKISIISSQKTQFAYFSNTPQALMIKLLTLPLTILTYLSKINRNWVKKYDEFEQKQRSSAKCWQNWNLDKCL